MAFLSGSPRNNQSNRIQKIFIIFALFLSGCGLNIQVNDGIKVSVPLENVGNQVNLDSEQTVFKVKIPYSIRSDESVAIDIVDEVNGLSNNIQRFIMTRLDDYHYEVTTSHSLGSSVKYRYVKIGAEEQSEITAIGSSVRYRMTYITRDSQIEDIIAGWPDSPFMGPTGEVSGVITSSFDSEPLADIMVCVGGYQTYTDNLGRFTVNHLPVGNQHLIAYSIDGSYQTFQHTANIMGNLITSAQIQMIELSEIQVTLIVTPPDDAIGAPIKIASNFLQFGNTFGELGGGVSISPARLPLMTKLNDGRYSITLNLHGGNDFRYIYTLGDSFWNSEQSLKNDDIVRQILVPNHDVVIEDTIESWRQNDAEPYVIEVIAPPETPVNDTVSIQFNLNEWSEPIPMWAMGNNHWLYLLFSPLPDLDTINFRFCRNDQCDLSSDVDTETAPFVLNPGMPLQNLIQLSGWRNWDPVASPTTVVAENILRRTEKFITGVELDPYYHPTQQTRFPFALQDLANIGTNTIILTPTWQVSTVTTLPNIEFHPGSDIFVRDLTELSNFTNEFGMDVILFPVLELPSPSEDWWKRGAEDALWWHKWYKEYADFLVSYAQLAEKLNIDKLIIGDPSISPSLPGGTLSEGSIAGAPANALEIWQDIFTEISEIYSGELIWSLPFESISDDYIPLIEQCGSIYLLFSPPIAEDNTTEDLQSLTETVSYLLDSDLKPFVINLNKPIYIGISYGSADGSGKNCVSSVDGSCIHGTLFATKAGNILSSGLDLQEQVDIYNVILKEISERDWIDGFISRGFYSSLQLTDVSSSIYGKPAMDVMWYWYSSIK